MCDMEKITKTLETMNKPGVSIPDLVILSATLTDDRFEDISGDIKEIHTTIETMSDSLTDQINGFKRDVMMMLGEFGEKSNQHTSNCKYNNNEELKIVTNRVSEIEKNLKKIDFVFFFTKYKKLAMLVSLGFIMLFGISGYRFYISYQTLEQSKLNGIQTQTNGVKIDKTNVELNKTNSDINNIKKDTQ